jgi:hypothetical protein
LQHFFYQTKLITKFVTKIFPLVSDCLSSWQNRLDDCPDENLRGQALASIKHKRFHAQGGSIYALYPGVPINPLLSFIVAFQTISDYLDNLCDRAQCLDGESFKQLHIALADAVSLNTTESTPPWPGSMTTNGAIDSLLIVMRALSGINFPNIKSAITNKTKSRSFLLLKRIILTFLI